MARRLLAAFAMAIVGLVVSAVAVIWMTVSTAAGKPRGHELAVGFDQLGNALAGGDIDEVYSSRCWRLRGKWPYRWLQPGIDWLFSQLGEENHCQGSFESEQRKLITRQVRA